MTDVEMWRRAEAAADLLLLAREHVSPAGRERLREFQESSGHSLGHNYEKFMAWVDADDEWREAVMLCKLEGKG